MVSRPEKQLRLGTLRRWAQQDAPGEYADALREQNVGYVRAALTGLHHDVAVAAYNVFADRFVCCSVRNNQWYRFEGHRWRPCDSGTDLRAALSTEIYEMFRREATAAAAAADNPASENAARMSKNADRLKTTAFKDAVMRELREHFHRDNFEGLLDSKVNLIGFENGVFDLDAREFRAGEPEDLITFSTGTSYNGFDPDDPAHEEIRRFFEPVQPDPAVRTYLLRFFASCLHGRVREHSFHIAQGVGSNGKSLTVDFLERALGEYAIKVPISLLTQKRAASAAASPEIIRMRGRRFACLQEPGNDETLNVGMMKEITGGDAIVVRGLYKDCIQFKPQFRLLLTANDLPKVRAADGGTWRRIKLLPFTSRFVENPDPARPNEFALDPDLQDRLAALAEPFMAYLIEVYYEYREHGNPPPTPVLSATREYQRRSDHMQLFIEKHVEVDSEATCDFNELFSLYKEFSSAENYGHVPKKQDFVAHVRNLVSVQMVSNDVGVGIRPLMEQRDLYMPATGAVIAAA